MKKFMNDLIGDLPINSRQADALMSLDEDEYLKDITQRYIDQPMSSHTLGGAAAAVPQQEHVGGGYTPEIHQERSDGSDAEAFGAKIAAAAEAQISSAAAEKEAEMKAREQEAAAETRAAVKDAAKEDSMQRQAHKASMNQQADIERSGRKEQSIRNAPPPPPPPPARSRGGHGM